MGNCLRSCHRGVAGRAKTPFPSPLGQGAAGCVCLAPCKGSKACPGLCMSHILLYSLQRPSSHVLSPFKKSPVPRAKRIPPSSGHPQPFERTPARALSLLAGSWPAALSGSPEHWELLEGRHQVGPPPPPSASGRSAALNICKTCSRLWGDE